MLKPSDYDIMDKITKSESQTAIIESNGIVHVGGEQFGHDCSRLFMTFALTVLDEAGAVKTVELSRNGRDLLRARGGDDTGNILGHLYGL